MATKLLLNISLKKTFIKYLFIVLKKTFYYVKIKLLIYI